MNSGMNMCIVYSDSQWATPQWAGYSNQQYWSYEPEQPQQPQWGQQQQQQQQQWAPMAQAQAWAPQTWQRPAKTFGGQQKGCQMFNFDAFDSDSDSDFDAETNPVKKACSSVEAKAQS